jgi:hypothetical protein
MPDKESDEAVLTDAAKAEIAEAVRIVASDKSYVNLEAIRKHLLPDSPENTPPKDGEPTAPPKKKGEKEEEKEEEKEPAKKKTGIWWGDRLDEE